MGAGASAGVAAALSHAGEEELNTAISTLSQDQVDKLQRVVLEMDGSKVNESIGEAEDLGALLERNWFSHLPCCCPSFLPLREGSSVLTACRCSSLGPLRFVPRARSSR